MRFEWHDSKNDNNANKHGVSFEEGQTVFFDENAFEFSDPDHSFQEDRFLLLGMSSALRVLVVSYCFRARDSAIRIISARKATSSERQFYERGSR